MSKKFFDIIPPQKIKQETPAYPKRKKGRRSNFFLTVAKRISLKSLIILSFVLILLIISSFLFFSETEIRIWPKTEILILTRTIIINSGTAPDQFEAEDEIISGRLLRDLKSGSQKFVSSGNVLAEGKAEGIIRVYNTHSTYSQGLLPNTRFVSAGGKLFKSIQKETIPGGSYQKGKFVPGEIDIRVRAAEAGEDYNIEPSTFSIPGFAGTPKYTTFYGKSFSPMTGGFRGEVSRVTQEDLDKAGNVLIERLKKESRDFLKKSLPDDFILLDEAVHQEVIKENYSVEAGTAAESFNLEVEVKSRVLIFKKSDIDELAANLINSNIDKDKRFYKESLEIIYSLEPSDVSETDRERINIKIKTKIYSDIDLDELKRALVGKPHQEVEMFLKDQAEITKIEIDLGQFWRKTIPENLDKIEIRLILED